MSKLKRTYIELVKNPEEVIKGGEPELEKIWTPHFIPWKTVRQALQTLSENEETESELDMLEKMEDFVANEIFKDQITVDELGERMHAPNGLNTLKSVIEFVASGNQGDADTKAFVEKKN